MGVLRMAWVRGRAVPVGDHASVPRSRSTARTSENRFSAGSLLHAVYFRNLDRRTTVGSDFLFVGAVPFLPASASALPRWDRFGARNFQADAGRAANRDAHGGGPMGGAGGLRARGSRCGRALGRPGGAAWVFSRGGDASV